MTAMKHAQCRAGFSLMEINMAVFVMAIGILGMVALFPLGLREAIQGRADLRQSMFADHVINQLTGLLSQTNLEWSAWQALDQKAWPEAVTVPGGPNNPAVEWKKATFPSGWDWSDGDIRGIWKSGGDSMQNSQYRIFFRLVGNDDTVTVRPSARVMGIGVRSTEQKVEKYAQYTNNVLYYAEVMFQGDPTQ